MCHIFISSFSQLSLSFDDLACVCCLYYMSFLGIFSLFVSLCYLTIIQFGVLLSSFEFLVTAVPVSLRIDVCDYNPRQYSWVLIILSEHSHPFVLSHRSDVIFSPLLAARVVLEQLIGLLDCFDFTIYH